MVLKELLFLTGTYKLYEKWLWNQIKNKNKPNHIAIILDGNRRWASKKLLDPWLGHKKGADKVETILTTGQ